MATKRRKHKLAPLLLLAGQAVAATSSQHDIIRPESVSPPRLNHTALGNIGVVGDFDALSVVNYVGEERLLSQAQANGGSSVIAQLSSDVYTVQSLADGLITAACVLSDNQTAILAGNFSHLLGIEAEGIGRLDLTSGNASAMGDLHLSGMVDTLWCNNSQVVVGGALGFGDSHGVAVWDNEKEKWQAAPFGGFSSGSRIRAITPVNDSVVFGGLITGLAESSNSSNSSDSLGSQPVGFGLGSATGYPSSTAEPEDLPHLLYPQCSNDGFEADLDSTTGYVEVDLGTTVTPESIRLYNQGTKLWRLVTSPADGIMNLTYKDPDTGEQLHCDAYCPLSENATYQDFYFVNEVPTTNLTIYLLDYYESRAGLRGMEMFEQGRYVYANSSLNEPNCNSTTSSPATSELEGQWSSGMGFEEANITAESDLTSTKATFYPGNSTQGRYEVLLYTPGCAEYGTCAERGAVNVTVSPGGSQTPNSLILYQTNEALKYDIIYNGTLGEGANIEVVPVPNQNLPLNFVAFKVSLNYLGPATNVSALYQYPSDDSSPINALGRELGEDADVRGITAINGSSLLIGGSQFSNMSSNLVALQGEKQSAFKFSGNVSKTVALENGSVAILTDSSSWVLNRDGSLNNLNVNSSAVVPFNLNGTNYWAFSGDNLSLWDAASSAFVNRTYPQARGWLSSSVTGAGAQFYFGSLQIADALDANGVTILEEHSGTISAVNKQPWSDFSSSSSIRDGVYLNDTLSLIVGSFNATVTDGNKATNALLVSGNTSQALPGLPHDNSTLNRAVLSARDPSLVALAGSAGISLYNLSANSIKNTNLSWEAYSVAFAPNTSQIVVAGGEGGIMLYDVNRSSWKAPSQGPRGSVNQLTFDSSDRVVTAGDEFGLLNITTGKWEAVSDAPSNTVTFAVLSQDRYAVATRGNLSYYDNGTWTNVSTPWNSTSSRIRTLSIVPAESSNSSSPLNSTSLLLLSGSLDIAGSSVSTVVWDGSSWTPFLATSDSSTESSANLGVRGIYSQHISQLDGGVISASARPQDNRGSGSGSGSGGGNGGTSGSGKAPMARGHVVGIACAIAIGCISLMITIYLLGSWLFGVLTRRQQEGDMRVSYQNLARAVPPEALIDQIKADPTRA